VQPDPLTERHHLVTRGYQQNFADDQKRIAVVSTSTGKVIDAARPIKSNFVAPGYTAHVTPSGEAVATLEHEFAKVERSMTDQIRRASPTYLGETTRQAIITLFAMHLVRSPSFLATHERIAQEVVEERVPRLIEREGLLQNYRQQFGASATVTEMQNHVRDLWAEMLEGNRMHVDGMIRQYNTLLDYLSRFHIQLLTVGIPDYGFVLSDVPVVHANTAAKRYGFRDGLGVAEADLFIGPLTRTTAALFSCHRERHETFRVKKKLDRINAVFVRAANAEIACHPADALALTRLWRRLDRTPTPPLRAA